LGRWDVVFGKVPNGRDRRVVQETRDSLQQRRASGCWDSCFGKFHGEKLTDGDETSVIFGFSPTQGPLWEGPCVHRWIARRRVIGGIALA
jgi:hypothetical protein